MKGVGKEDEEQILQFGGWGWEQSMPDHLAHIELIIGQNYKNLEQYL